MTSLESSPTDPPDPPEHSSSHAVQSGRHIRLHSTRSPAHGKQTSPESPVLQTRTYASSVNLSFTFLNGQLIQTWSKLYKFKSSKIEWSWRTHLQRKVRSVFNWDELAVTPLSILPNTWTVSEQFKHQGGDSRKGGVRPCITCTET